jgi:hypothetical protein
MMTAIPVTWLLACVLAGPPSSVSDILQRLGDVDFAVRETAQADLFLLEPSALPELVAALKHPDPEVRRWVRAVLPGLRNQERVEQTLRPHLVRLQYINATLEDILFDAAEQTGIALHPPDLSLERRWQRFTFDTGELPPWEALYRVLQVTGLRPEPAFYTEPVTPEEEPLRARARFMWARRGRSMLPNLETSPLRLQDAPIPDGTVRSVRGPLCIEAGPVPGTRVEYPEPFRELSLPLTFQLEPRYAFRGIASISLDEIRDEHGQRLPSVYRAHDPVLNIDYFTVPRNLDDNDRGRWWYRRAFTLAIQTLAKPSRKLEVVRGRVALGVLGPAEDLAKVQLVPGTIPDAVATADGGQMRVTKAENDGEGTWTLEITLTHPEAGGWVGIGTEALLERSSNHPIRLLDGKGRAIRMGGGLIDNRNEHVSLIRVTFVATEDQDGPATLIYTGRRPIDLEVPFELRNIPLP